jgi:hypothetical protein
VRVGSGLGEAEGSLALRVVITGKLSGLLVKTATAASGRFEPEGKPVP